MPVTHTHRGGRGDRVVRGVYVYVYLCILNMFQVSHKAIQPNQSTISSLLLLLLFSVCLFVVGFSVIVCTLLYTLSTGRGNLGGFRRGVREGVSRVDSQPLDQPKITLLYLYCVYLSLFAGSGWVAT